MSSCTRLVLTNTRRCERQHEPAVKKCIIGIGITKLIIIGIGVAKLRIEPTASKA